MLYIGTSGWQYRDWRLNFYPQGVLQADWLRFYSQRFRSVEVNNTFYRLPPAQTFARWREQTPPDFVVTVKMSGFLTHRKRLKDPEEPLQRFMANAAALGDKLGPVLLQLPPNFPADLERLADVLALFKRSVRVAVEFRHESWHTEDVAGLLENHGAAFCLADSPRRKLPDWRTADWGFVRFHEGSGRPHPSYGEGALAGWADRLAKLWKPSEDVYAYFNNDTRCCAVRDAVVFAGLAERAGLRPTRVPQPSEVSLRQD